MLQKDITALPCISVNHMTNAHDNHNNVNKAR